MPKAFWVPAVEVAKVGVRGMDDNRAVAIPGLANRMSAAVGWLSPRRVLLPMVARQHPGLPDA
jgi:hypothetical protein